MYSSEDSAPAYPDVMESCNLQGGFVFETEKALMWNHQKGGC